MDDEFEIRERNTKIVMQLIGEADREVIPNYAQELFIDFLLNKLDNLEKYDVIAVLTLIVIDGSEGKNSLDDNIVEYRVFEKNEVNIFSETHIVKKMCVNKLRKEISKFDGKSIGENVAEIVKASQKLKNAKSKESVEIFLKNQIINEPAIEV